MPQRQTRRNGEVQVSPWVAVVTYLFCWGLGAYLVVGPAPKSTPVLVAAATLILFPVAGFKPLELLREIVRRDGG